MLEKIDRPKIEILEIKDGDRYGKFSVEPLQRGYGHTLGNSLRRILLSSIDGAAVTSVRIQGIEHEFTTIPGILEDVTELVLNLKEIRLKIYSDEIKTLRIEKEGEGIITAADIILDSDVEVLNPDLVIANLEPDGRLFAELTAQRGQGYATAERNKDNDPTIGTVWMDSVFSPIKRVNYHVENARVGQVTDFDKLIIEVWTDGTVTPQEALSSGSRIICNLLNLFIDLTENNRDVEEEPQEDDLEESLKEDKLKMTIEDLDLSVRSFNCLKRAGINTVSELVIKTEEDMMRVRNLGKKSLEEVVLKLGVLGLSLRKPDE
ncbi:MAG: DNA-directed RNA polymerase subunit alpha [Firmicutes bacterium]|jgi:DNA-directed RNA polymerase subunit alpha|nr:DNA-directed RNA polymerase subunit alpha [Bacillota bacterium]